MKCCKHIHRYNRNKSEESGNTTAEDAASAKWNLGESGTQTKEEFARAGHLQNNMQKDFRRFWSAISVLLPCVARTFSGKEDFPSFSSGAFLALHTHWFTLLPLLLVARLCCFARLLASFPPFSAGHLALLLFCISSVPSTLPWSLLPSSSGW